MSIYTQGAFVGSATALSFMTWLCITAQRAISTGELRFDTKEVSTSGCTYHFIPDDPMSMLAINETVTTTATPSADYSGFQIHHVSYIWYTLIGCTICIVVSLIISYIFGPNDPADLDPNLLAPFVRKLIKPSAHVTKPSKHDLIKANEALYSSSSSKHGGADVESRL